MLDANGFVQSGWVHDLLLHQFESDKFVIKGKVKCLLLSSNVQCPCFRLSIHKDCQVHHCFHGVLLCWMVKYWQLTAHAWLGKFKIFNT